MKSVGGKRLFISFFWELLNTETQSTQSYFISVCSVFNNFNFFLKINAILLFSIYFLPLCGINIFIKRNPNKMKNSRRNTIKGLAAWSLLGMSASTFSCTNSNESTTKKVVKDMVTNKEPFFKISLAQWSLHNSFFGDILKSGDFAKFGKMLMTDPDSLLQGHLKPIDFPTIAKKDFGVDAIELVNTFYFSKAKDTAYWKDYRNRCDGEGVKAVLIMCDALGDLGDQDAAKRQAAVENHKPWLDTLSAIGQQEKINVIVENHGSYSSNGAWLASVISQVNNPYCGTLPDFGNFCMERGPDGCMDEYDRYKGTAELMPFAKGVSAKTHDFDADGNEIHTDYKKMLTIVKDAGYTGYIDIEYEGKKLSEPDGIMATKRLLERVGAELA